MKNLLVVDDSALMRRLFSDIINSDGMLNTDTYARNGLDALHILERGKKFDLILLDINMPEMDGLDFLREINRRGMKQKVIIVSTLAKQGAKETILALELGAFDFVTKPDSLSDAKGEGFKRQLLEKIYVSCGLDVHEIDDNAIENDHTPFDVFKIQRKRLEHTSDTEEAVKKEPISDKKNHSKSPLRGNAEKVVALACSTGGPKALQYVIPFLPANLDAAILLVQHMPEGFTASLSSRLDELSRINVKEAEEGDVLQKGTVYVAKGGFQMRLKEEGRKQFKLSVVKEPARHGLRPCADIMYESLVGTSFDEITCVIMTGMGADGTKGILQLEQKNQVYVIAQDEPSCTVYGMPKAIAESGSVDEVVPLKKIADAITKHVGVR